MESRKKGGALSPVLLAARTILFGALLALAKAFGPRIPDPVKRNLVTQVEKKR